MLKKILSFVLCIMFLANFVIPVKAATLGNDTCKHDRGTYEIVDGKSITGISDEGHTVLYNYTTLCNLCHYSLGSGTRESLENHIFYTDVNLGHKGTTNKHFYRIRCSDCGYSKVIEVPCHYLDCVG